MKFILLNNSASFINLCEFTYDNSLIILFSISVITSIPVIYLSGKKIGDMVKQGVITGTAASVIKTAIDATIDSWKGNNSSKPNNIGNSNGNSNNNGNNGK